MVIRDTKDIYIYIDGNFEGEKNEDKLKHVVILCLWNVNPIWN